MTLTGAGDMFKGRLMKYLKIFQMYLVLWMIY